MAKPTRLAITIILCALACNMSNAQLVFNGSMLGPLRVRSIGPAVTSGRISDIAVVDTAAHTFYVGAAGGGVWRTTNGGVTFESVFDEHPQSIGAITIDQKHPDTVWVGTGESSTRNSVSIGAGIFRTTDKGRTWINCGLDSTERIARIAIDPNNSKTVFVASPGPLFADSDHRGLYRTTDLGSSWTKVLAGDARTGCSDVVIDPKNPKNVFASMWSFRRTPYSFVSGGPGSGIFRSTDGGQTWTRLTKGLPSENLGRIAIAMSPLDSKLLFASIEAKESSLYVSTDGGLSWERRYSGSVVDIRPFYFSRLICDPVNKDVIYKCGIQMYRSQDAGRTFSTIASSAHGDHHAVWIDPENPEHIILGTDGGVYESMEQGKSVRFMQNLPVAQFYHVITDDARPFNLYGGMQDNGSWRGPSNVDGGITNHDWKFIGGGDGFYVVPERADASVVYWESQGGNIKRTNLLSKETKNVAPTPDDGTLKLRYNWNTPIVRGSAPGVLYVGSQYLHKTTDRGDTWKRMSPDLTTNDSENHCTIYSIAESPRNIHVVWVGTDDGNLQLTRDGGGTWTNVTPPDLVLPSATCVSYIDASSIDEGSCYVAFDGHMNGNMHAYVAHTTDFGENWTFLPTLEVKGYAHVIRQDPVNPSLLYLGTEEGLWLSLDAGSHWIAFRNNLPRVAVRDIAFQERDHALAIATHGRGMYVMDNLNVLRAIDPKKITGDVSILPTVPAVRRQAQGAGRWCGGDAEYVGESLSEAARVWYVLQDQHVKGDFTIMIKDSLGQVIRTVPASTRKGLNSVELPLRQPAPLTAHSKVSAAMGTLMGPLLSEGRYFIELIKAGVLSITTIDVITDSAYGHSADDRSVQQKLIEQLYRLNEDLAITVARIETMQDTLRLRLVSDSSRQAVDNGSPALLDSLAETLAGLFGEVNAYLGRPSASQLSLANTLADKVNQATLRVEGLLAAVKSESRQETELRLRKEARQR